MAFLNLFYVGIFKIIWVHDFLNYFIKAFLKLFYYFVSLQKKFNLLQIVCLVFRDL